MVKIIKLDLPFRRDDERFTGRQLLHCLRRHVERRLDRRTLACDDNNVVVDVIEPRPYAVRVARRERPPVASHPAKRPRPVGSRKRLFDRRGDVAVLRRLLGNQFRYEVAVGLARREGAMPAVVLEKLRRVREVEVARKKKRMPEVARLVDERMAKRHVVFTERGVAEMAEEYALLRLFPLGYHAKDIYERRSRSRLEDAIRRFPRLWRGGEKRGTRAVLPAVVLLFEKKRQFCPAEVARGNRGLSQDHHRHGAFMLNEF